MPNVLRHLLRVISPAHVWLYRRGGGRGVDHLAANRMPILLLTTTGRRSQQPRTVPVGFARDGQDLVLLVSNGGQEQPPGWTLNLRAHAEAEVEIGRQRLRVRADWPEGAERQRLWDLVVRDFPVFNDYQRKVARTIPVIRLRPLPPAR